MPAAAAFAEAADTMYLTDEPGNWFRSEATGTPLSIIGEAEPSPTNRSRSGSPGWPSR